MEEVKRQKQSKLDTIKQLHDLWEKNPELTRDQLSVLTGYSTNYIDSLWCYVIGQRNAEELIGGNYVTYVTPNETASAQVPVMIQIPEFVPKPKKFIDRNGKECTDVSEFFGIIENGGECYRDVRFTIPKGRQDLREVYENGIME